MISDIHGQSGHGLAAVGENEALELHPNEDDLMDIDGENAEKADRVIHMDTVQGASGTIIAFPLPTPPPEEAAIGIFLRLIYG